MSYSDIDTKADEYADSAIQKIREVGLAPNPENFAIWFHYFMQDAPNFVRTIDVMLSNNVAFSEERAQEIYRRFFKNDFELNMMNEAVEGIDSELNKALEIFDEAGTNSKEYGTDLASLNALVEKTENVGDLKQLIEKTITLNRVMGEKNAKLQQDLQESTNEISKLQKEMVEARQEAFTDGLTGIANRRHFDEQLRNCAMEAMEQGFTLCLLLIDIDHFKKFNDNYGHQMGDSVIKLLATTLKDTVKGKDFPARYGGEEFAVILPQTSLENSIILAENIGKQIGEKKIVNRATRETIARITVTIGASLFEYGEPLSEFIERADKALYLGKESGRNCVRSQNHLAMAESG